MKDSSYDRYINKNLKWNFFANVGDLSAVNLARAFIFSTTVLPLYTSYLTSSAILIGLIPAVLEVGFLLPQIFTARKAESMGRMKPFVVKVSIFERLPYLVIALVILFWPGSPKWLAYTVLILSIAVASGSGGLATPAWKTMLAKVIHPDRKALLFSLGMGIGGFLGIGGAYISRIILDTQPYPFSYGYCFALAFAGQALSWIFLTFNREPEREMTPEHDSFLSYFRGLPQFLMADRNFARYLLGQCFITLGAMGATFYVVYGRIQFGISDGFAASLTMVSLISLSAAMPFIGWLSDKVGHKLVTQWSVLVGIGAIVTVIFLPSAPWLGLVFVLMNLSRSGIHVSRASITMEFGSIDKLPTYTAITGLVLWVPTIVAPVLGGWLIESLGYQTMFITAIVFSLIGFFITSRGVRDPRRGEMHESH